MEQDRLDRAFWHASLSTDFPCAGRVVHIAITALHHDTGRPVVELTWSSRPKALTPADIAEFDARKKAATMALEDRLWSLERFGMSRPLTKSPIAPPERSWRVREAS